jgi:eukaryotic-like serine/threonine-protein kinase
MGPSAKKVGKYVLYELLAKGGMAEVYRGKMVGAGGFEKRVAIKRILSDFANSQEFQKMFLAEANVMSTLEHANIVQVLDFFRERDELFLVMDFIFGRNLRQILKRAQEIKTPLPIPIALYMMAKTAEALDFAHRKADAHGKSLGIIHRDVSPQNIMVSFDGDVKIVDFGIAKLANSAEKTQTGVLKGKFGYMSPEQIEGLTLDYRSDIFSLGVVLYECLAGRKLFQADTEVQIIKMIQTFRTPRIAADRPEVSEDLEKIMQRALLKDRVKRYQSALEMADELSSVLMKEYGGCNALKSADYLKRLFKDEYHEAMQMMKAQTEVVAIADPASMTQVKERSKLQSSATGNAGTVTPMRQKKVGEPTVVKSNPEHRAAYHPFSLGPNIRFKVELDDNKPWPIATKKTKDAPAGKKGKSKRSSLLKDPKKRRLLLVAGVAIIALMTFLPNEDKPSAVNETEATTTEDVLKEVEAEFKEEGMREPSSDDALTEEDAETKNRLDSEPEE